MATVRDHPTLRSPRRLRLATVGAGLTGVAVVGGGLRPFTLPATVLVFSVVGLAFVVLEPVRRAGAVAGTRGPAGRGWPWLLLLGVALAWELAALSGSPRQQHPTLSSLLDSLTGGRLGATVAWLVWLVLGLLILRRRA